jgi:hypothetical protein
MIDIRTAQRVKRGMGRIASNGPRLAVDGKVLKAGGIITDGPIVEIREI